MEIKIPFEIGSTHDDGPGIKTHRQMLKGIDRFDSVLRGINDLGQENEQGNKRDKKLREDKDDKLKTHNYAATGPLQRTWPHLVMGGRNPDKEEQNLGDEGMDLPDLSGIVGVTEGLYEGAPFMEEIPEAIDFTVPSEEFGIQKDSTTIEGEDAMVPLPSDNIEIDANIEVKGEVLGNEPLTENRHKGYNALEDQINSDKMVNRGIELDSQRIGILGQRYPREGLINKGEPIKSAGRPAQNEEKTEGFSDILVDLALDVEGSIGKEDGSKKPLMKDNLSVSGTFMKDESIIDEISFHEGRKEANLKEEIPDEVLGTAQPLKGDQSIDFSDLILERNSVDRFEAIDEIAKMMVTVLNSDETQLEIQVYPEHLGRITLKVSMEEGSLIGRISTGTEETRDILKSRMGDLENSLLEQGLRFASLDVNVDERPGPNNFNHGYYEGLRTNKTGSGTSPVGIESQHEDGNNKVAATMGPNRIDYLA